MFERLRVEFGAVPAEPQARQASPGTRLHALQGGLASHAAFGPFGKAGCFVRNHPVEVIEMPSDRFQKISGWTVFVLP